MATATGSSGSPPPPPPPNFWKLSGMKKVDVNLDPTKPLIGVAEILIWGKYELHEN